jgi:hypothetical protein
MAIIVSAGDNMCSEDTSKMRPSTPSKSFLRNPADIAAAIVKAPDQVQYPECPYDPSDPVAVEGFWKDATVRHPGQRGPGKKASYLSLAGASSGPKGLSRRKGFSRS